MPRLRGPIRKAVAAALLAGPGTTRAIAARANVANEHARRTLDNMVRSRQVAVIATARVSGVKRPVPVYDLAAAPNDAPAPDLELQHLLRAWIPQHDATAGA